MAISGWPEKRRLAAALKQITSGSNRRLAHRLQRGAPNGVNSFHGRFWGGGGTYTRSFQSAVGPFTK